MSKILKNTINGWLVIDKPLGITSTKVGQLLKKILRPEKIGHVGTLDPLASGVLVVALGEATKLIPYAPPAFKKYEFDLTFGEKRTTDDKEGDVIDTTSLIPSLDEIRSVLTEFEGSISQVPPAYSAIHVNGKRAYALAREGKEVRLNSRTVEIIKLDCEGRAFEKSPDPHEPGSLSSLKTVGFTVTCRGGTYVRSLARDIAERLHSLGYVSYLRRLVDAPFSIAQAISLDALSSFEETIRHLLPLSAMIEHLPSLYLDNPHSEEDIKRLYQGQPIKVSAPSFQLLQEKPASCLSHRDPHDLQPGVEGGKRSQMGEEEVYIRVHAQQGDLVAIGVLKPQEENILYPKRLIMDKS